MTRCSHPSWISNAKKAAAWLQDAVNFGECVILQLARAQMMQDKNSNRRGEGAVGKWHRCSVALHDAGVVSALLRKPRGKRMIVFEAGHARNSLSQFDSGSAWSSANFQKMIA